MDLYNLQKITHIRNVDHPESISVGPDGTAYTTGTGGQVYRLHLDSNTSEQFASTAPRRVLGQAVDFAGALYCADIGRGEVVRITPQGKQSVYATAPGGAGFSCPNYPAFDRSGDMYLSDSGDWSGVLNGRLYKIPRNGGCAAVWYPGFVDSPNAIALDAEEAFLYFVETLGNSIARVRIRKDGSAGEFERVLHMPCRAPDGIAFDEDGRLWIACHRPDSIWVFDLRSKRLELFADDWRGEELRGPTDVAFAGPQRDILLAASLDNLVVHRFDGAGVRGLRLNFPRIEPQDGNGDHCER
jgi:gluconolactonase